MTIKVNIESNVKEINKKLGLFKRKHLPQITADSINEVGVKSVNAMRTQLAKKLDRPTMFTVKGVKLYKAKPNDPSALVFIPDIQAEYLEKQFEGGMRLPKKDKIPVPVDKTKLNAFGNIRGKRTGLIKRSTEFMGNVKGIDGVWRRVGGKRNPKLKLIVAFENSVFYRKRIEFYKTVSGVVKNNINKILNKNLRRVIGR
jgi:hypothetical protein|tara:strand:- start:158 stop:757 length:600 start_codon:yes stop_codon:yes gene_type:complete